jgi:chloramphenicol-sensitive protein RarD
MLDRQGVLAAILAYSAWGLFPIYWQLLKRISALETMSHRVIWSLGFYMVVAMFQKRFSQLWHLSTYSNFFGKIALSAVLIAFNWLLYVWAVTHGHVMETSLGYFINPLISVAIGSLLFKERLLVLQKISLLLAIVGVAWLTYDYGRPPWIALGLAISFAIYGALKKTMRGDATLISVAETSLLFPFALLGAVLIRQHAHVDQIAAGALSFSSTSYALIATTLNLTNSNLGDWDSAAQLLRTLVSSPNHLTTLEWVCIIGGGVITGIPLLLFGFAAQRLPLSILGFFQYLAPTLQFLSAIFFFNEPLNRSRLVGFAWIWLALGIFLYHLFRMSRRQRSESLSI